MSELEELSHLDLSPTVVLVVAFVVVLGKFLQGFKTVYIFLKDWFERIKEAYVENEHRKTLIYENKQALESFMKDQVDENSKLESTLNDIQSSLKDISGVIVDIQVSEMRSGILDFASAVSNGRIYTREQFLHIFKIHENYERVIHERGLSNEEVLVSMRIIREVFEERTLTKTFVEDLVNTSSFKDSVSRILKNNEDALSSRNRVNPTDS